MEKILDSGDFLLKIKIGSDPDGDRDPEKMLEWDKNRLSFLHELARERTTPYTDNGKIAYYLDEMCIRDRVSTANTKQERAALRIFLWSRAISRVKIITYFPSLRKTITPMMERAKTTGSHFLFGSSG